ncbi:hypothetical protein ACFX2G_034769 [Malus domestica]
MVYSTYSINSLENEVVVAKILRRGVNQQQNSRVNYRQSRLRPVMKSFAKEIAFHQHFQPTLQGGIDKFTSNASAKAVKLILYFQYKDGKRMGVFENLFFRRELPLKGFDVEQRQWLELN